MSYEYMSGLGAVSAATMNKRATIAQTSAERAMRRQGFSAAKASSVASAIAASIRRRQAYKPILEQLARSSSPGKVAMVADAIRAAMARNGQPQAASYAEGLVFSFRRAADERKRRMAAAAAEAERKRRAALAAAQAAASTEAERKRLAALAAARALVAKKASVAKNAANTSMRKQGFSSAKSLSVASEIAVSIQNKRAYKPILYRVGQQAGFLKAVRIADAIRVAMVRNKLQSAATYAASVLSSLRQTAAEVDRRNRAAAAARAAAERRRREAEAAARAEAERKRRAAAARQAAEAAAARAAAEAERKRQAALAAQAAREEALRAAAAEEEQAMLAAQEEEFLELEEQYPIDEEMTDWDFQWEEEPLPTEQLEPVVVVPDVPMAPEEAPPSVVIPPDQLEPAPEEPILVEEQPLPMTNGNGVPVQDCPSTQTEECWWDAHLQACDCEGYPEPPVEPPAVPQTTNGNGAQTTNGNGAQTEDEEKRYLGLTMQQMMLVGAGGAALYFLALRK